MSRLWENRQRASQAQSKKPLSEASKTVRGVDWFEVFSLRGRITKNKVECFQAVVKRFQGRTLGSGAFA